MVGPGTGVAPFRSFAWHLLAVRRSLGEPAAAAIPPAVLFFGCRHAEKDFLYGDEYQELVGAGALSEVCVAFSRDQEQKVYVQHRLRERGALLCELLLQRPGVLYICG
jgi:NADPH-ferrihemoprotein reductase